MAEMRVESEVTGMVCQVLVKPGDVVAEFDPVVLIESMKMEIPVAAPKAGTITAVHVVEGAMVSEGDVTVTLST
jgi:biotin carboxyl carrier protein